MLRWLKTALVRVDAEAWKRFFIAIGGLGISFAAALFSTVFREEGNFSATALLASFALISAGVVGMLTVPYLAKRVTMRRFRERFQYDFTREGMAYIIIILVIGVAALNTSNNLLFIIVSAMLGAFVVSGVASAGMLRNLELDVALPNHVFAKRPVQARLELSNLRTWAPAFSVNVTPKLKPPRVKNKWQHGVFSWPPWKPPEQRWLHLNDWVWKPEPRTARPAGIFAGAVYFPYIARVKAASADVELNFAKRGAYAQDGLGLATRFPFSFLSKTRPVQFSREVIVYPSVEQTDEFFQVLPMITGEFETFVRGRGNNLYLIRDHTAEDSVRHLDWKATAKTGALKVREFTREDERKLRIVFDNAPPGAVSEREYEDAIALTASLAWHFAQSDAQLSFAAPEYSGSSDIYDFLAYLALVQPAKASVLENLSVSDDYNVIVTAQPRGTIPTNLWACSYLIFMHEQERTPAGAHA